MTKSGKFVSGRNFKMNFDASAYVSVGVWEPDDDVDDEAGGANDESGKQQQSSLPGPGQGNNR